jgi:hypothetical protein
MAQRPSREQTPFFLRYDHAQVTGDTTVRLLKNTSGQQLRIDEIVYINPTGLAQDGSNYFAIQVKQGSVVVGEWSTLTGAEGTIAADTYVALDLSDTDADLIIEDDEILTLLLDETGTATLPAGSIEIRGRFV